MEKGLYTFLIGVALFLAVLGAIIAIFFSTSTATRIEDGDRQIERSVAELDAALSERVERIESVLGQLAEENATLSALLEQEATRRSETQEEVTSRLEELEVNISSELANLQEGTVDLISEWIPFVYRLTCEFEESDNRGSAVLVTDAEGTRFVTNRHVLVDEDTGEVARSCRLLQPEKDTDAIAVDMDSVTYEEDRDYATGKIFDTSLEAVTTDVYCSESARIGDEVVVLGYPTIGGVDSFTATEGILSGFDGEYYTSSAKVEKGNSGGAAIDVRNECLLGLPTLVYKGRVEALARILPLGEGD